MAALPPPIAHTAEAIDAAYVKTARNGDSMGVPMSQVINSCDRALWYFYRWCAELEAPEGSRQRRFATGEHYEEVMLRELRMIGCTVWDIDDTTGKQFRVDLANGHLRGKLDGVAVGLPEAPATPHAVECKSSNDKSFKAITNGKVRDTKPEHHAQIQLYMHALGLTRGLYMLANKNDDARYLERVEYDAAFCLGIIARIERIVSLDRPPARLHEDPTSKGAVECLFCTARPVCHEGRFARTNCRTCIASTPHDGPRWTCAKWDNEVRSYSAQQEGCSLHRFIPELVPGEQVDADPAAETITYRMADGSLWIDGKAT